MKAKRLTLHKETLVTLGARALDAVRGQMLRSNGSCNNWCSANTACPTYCGTCDASCWSHCTCLVDECHKVLG